MGCRRRMNGGEGSPLSSKLTPTCSFPALMSSRMHGAVIEL